MHEYDPNPLLLLWLKELIDSVFSGKSMDEIIESH
jgi:hypothetical protein